MSQTRENHEALACLLAAVRQARRSTADAKGPQADWQPIPVSSDAELAAHARIEQALNSMATVEFLETPLSEVARYLQDTHQIPVILDKRALDDVGMGSDTPVTISIHGISVRSALNLMLKELDLTYVVRDEVLIITTPETSQRELPMFVYPVSDFLVPTSEPVNARMPGGALSSLLDMIESTVMPDTWDHVGGAGCISPIEPWGLLVISQTEEVHERVTNLLQTARRARHAAPAVAGVPQSLTPTIQLPLGAPLVPPTPPTVLPPAAVSCHSVDSCAHDSRAGRCLGNAEFSPLRRRGDDPQGLCRTRLRRGTTDDRDSQRRGAGDLGQWSGHGSDVSFGLAPADSPDSGEPRGHPGTDRRAATAESERRLNRWSNQRRRETAPTSHGYGVA